MAQHRDKDKPKYRISVISQMVDMHPQTIRTYERMGLINPSRSSGNTRLFSDRDKELLEKIQTMTRELGVNLAGVEIILSKINQIEKMNEEACGVISQLLQIIEQSDVESPVNRASLLEQCDWLNLDNLKEI